MARSNHQGHAAIALVLALGAVGGALAGCRAKIEVDTKDLEARIADSLANDHAKVDSVACPQGIVPKTGATFSCTVVIGGKPYERVIVLTGIDKGQLSIDARWARGEAVPSSWLSSVSNDNVKEQIGATARIDCGEPLRFLSPERTVRCDVIEGGPTTGAVFTIEDNRTTWEFEPPMLLRAKLEAALTASVRDKLGAQATITCGERPAIPRPSDGVVACSVTVGTKQTRINVDVDDHFVVKRWRLPEAAKPR